MLSIFVKCRVQSGAFVRLLFEGLTSFLIGWNPDGRGRARVTFEFGEKWEGYKLEDRRLA